MKTRPAKKKKKAAKKKQRRLATAERPRAVAAICIVWRTPKKDAIALIKRRDDHPHHLSGQWFFPGGGVGQNEHPGDAAVRETLEESGVYVGTANLVDVYSLMEYWTHGRVSYSQPILLAVYEAFHTKGALSAIEECTEAKWVPIELLSDFIHVDTQRSHLSPVVRTVLGLAT